MDSCIMCPRSCRVNRHTAKGFCGVGADIIVARAAPHYWEEPCISGTKGSGTIFFSGCNLRCVYCQNSAISRGGVGKAVTAQQLAAIMHRLAATGVHNINLVTPSHYTHAIAAAIDIARGAGLDIPIVWNSSGYENAAEIAALKGKVDIYLPDFKYKSAAIAAKYSAAANYFDIASKALDEMVLQQGGAVFKGNLMVRGVIVRHLVLPGCVEDSKSVLAYLHRRYGNAIYISIMSQYTPMGTALPDSLNRPLTEAEYNEVKNYAMRIGINQGFFQEGAAVGESFIPSFDLIGV